MPEEEEAVDTQISRVRWDVVAGAAAIGDWLEVRVDIQKRGARLAFANCYVSKGDERIARASAVFMVTEQGTERIGG